MGCALPLGLCRYDVDSCFTTFFLDDHWAMGLGVMMFFFYGGFIFEIARRLFSWNSVVSFYISFFFCLYFLKFTI